MCRSFFLYAFVFAGTKDLQFNGERTMSWTGLGWAGLGETCQNGSLEMMKEILLLACAGDQSSKNELWALGSVSNVRKNEQNEFKKI